MSPETDAIDVSRELLVLIQLSAAKIAIVTNTAFSTRTCNVTLKLGSVPANGTLSVEFAIDANPDFGRFRIVSSADVISEEPLKRSVTRRHHAAIVRLMFMDAIARFANLMPTIWKNLILSGAPSVSVLVQLTDARVPRWPQFK